MKSVQKLMDLSGRVALVTGGGGHLGAAMGEALAELGCNIAVLDRDEGQCNKVAQQLAGTYAIETLPMVVDLDNETEVRGAKDTVLENFGRLDILINNAALVGTSDLQGWGTSFAEQSAETWRLAMEINLTVPFVLAQTCAPALAERGTGSIINISSIYGLVGPDLDLYKGTSMGLPAAYAASKGGLCQFTRYLSTVFAPDIRVNTITVGGVRRGQDESFLEKYTRRTPLGRMATEEDLKGAAVYLATDLSAYVTGHNLAVDGGWTAW
jgi:NAD(P)-dependent dehydrogenase (short-subunit alcohol dehydrogenase family)